MPVRAVGTLLIFVVTMALVIIRPRRWPEAIWTSLGAAIVLATRLVTLSQAGALLRAAADALWFLAALLILAALLERSGFFEWAAIRAAQLAGGRVHALYRNVFVLGAAITAVLSLDTTAVILTPIVLSFVRRLKLPAAPFVFACAFVANTASLPLPVSNLTNLVFASSFHLTFGRFALRMLVPALIAVAVNHWLFWRLFRSELPRTFAPESLPRSDDVIPHRGYFRWSVGVLVAVCIGYFIAPAVHVEPYVVGIAGCVVLAAAGAATRRLERGILRKISWSIFPFVVGLFIVVQAIENLGVARAAAAFVGNLPRSPVVATLVAAAGAAVASNVVNNLPATLLARGALHAANASRPAIYGALVGVNVGPNLLVVGSLATMLVLTRARRESEAPSGLAFFLVGLRVTPVVLAVTALALAATFFVR
jgi:arsenical pump membrane protein